MSISGLRKSLVNRFQVIFSLVIDGGFLFVWRALTVGVDRLLSIWNVEGTVSVFSAHALEWLFATFTLIPVVSFLLYDTWQAIKQVWREGNNDNT